MSYLQSVPKGSVDALTWLGKKQWLTATRQGFEVTEAKVESMLDEAGKYGRQFSEDVRNVFWHCSTYRPNGNISESVAFGRRLHFFIASHVLATGQKSLLLSQALCEAFENTEVTVQFREYRQPYETMVVELPATYAESKMVEGLADYPTCIAIHHDEAEDILMLDLVLRNASASYCLPYLPEDDIDDCIQRLQLRNAPSGFDGETENRRLVPFFRIALNAMLAMTYGTDGNKVTVTKLPRQTKKAIQKRAAGKDKFIAHRARLRLAALPTCFQFDQKIKAFDEQPPSPQSPSTNSGSPKKPHWRKGHWRQQAVGQGRAERELRWIRPMLIRADRFGGDLKDTKTTYTT